VSVGSLGNGDLDTPTVSGGRTPGGLARRVRGANAPAATNVAAAFGGGGGVGQPASEMPSSADDVASFLSAFSGGVERGLSETHHEEEDQ
jgi:hypothetical protein